MADGEGEGAGSSDSSSLLQPLQRQGERLTGFLSRVREPVKSRREDLIPGPDVIGRVEGAVRGTAGKVREGGPVRNRMDSNSSLPNSPSLEDLSEKASSDDEEENRAVPKAIQSDSDVNIEV